MKIDKRRENCLMNSQKIIFKSILLMFFLPIIEVSEAMLYKCIVYSAVAMMKGVNLLIQMKKSLGWEYSS